jgi:SAM-dependent methyltransferase
VRGGGALRRILGRGSTGELPEELIVASEEDRRYLDSHYDDSVPLPAGAAEHLRADNPELDELRSRYAALDLPVTVGSRWNADAVEGFLDLRWFRGESLIYWHYRELPRISRLKYFILARYVRDRDAPGFLDRLAEDGRFGCWTFSYPGEDLVSRDRLESANELLFLERELGLTSTEGLSVLDIGAGYGRLGHRMSEAVPALTDYCCVDAVPESTFVSDYYLSHRGAVPPARVVPLDAVDGLAPGSFDLAVNIHSWSECTHAAIAWWVKQLERLEIPRIFLIPNEPTEFLSREVDGSRRDFMPLLAGAGYRVSATEPIIEDPAVRDLLGLDDHFFLLERG